MTNLNYSKLAIQDYLKLENCTTKQAKIMFRFRCRMAEFGENFRGMNGPKTCPLCSSHLDNQESSFKCSNLRHIVNNSPDYHMIFKKNIPTKIFEILEKIMAFREDTNES